MLEIMGWIINSVEWAIVQRRAAARAGSGVVWIAAVAGVVTAPAAVAATPTGPPAAPRTHGVMLYLSQPIGGGGGVATHPKWGFRVEQMRMVGNSGAPEAGDPIQHRALVGWQMDGLEGFHASDMKVELGGRMTYDVMRGAFGRQPGKTSATVPGSRPASITATDTATETKPFSLHLFEPGTPFSRDPARQTGESASIVHNIAAAAIGSLKLSRPVPVQQHSGLGPPASMREGR